VARPIGGKLADRIGGAKVTFWNFVAMTTATVGLLYSLQVKAFPAVPVHVLAAVHHHRAFGQGFDL